MNLILILFLLVITSGMKFSEPNAFNMEYCSVRITNSIKGVFALLIMLCHSMDYFAMGDGDSWLVSLSVYMKQMIVTPILFYSGYGIMESIQKKGRQYINSIPRQRILKTFIWADISVMVYAVYHLVAGTAISVKQFFLSLIFWETIENNTWYFFVIIVLYFITYISFRIFHRNSYLAAAVTTVLSFIPFYFLIRYRDVFWYNTFFVYHFGIWFSLLRKYIEKIVMRNSFVYGCSMLLVCCGYSLLHTFGSFYYYIVCCCLFVTCVVGVTMKVSLDNPLIQFVGKHVFGFYVFHRLPMRILHTVDIANFEKFIISFAATCLLSVAFDYVAAWLDTVVFFKKKKTDIVA